MTPLADRTPTRPEFHARDRDYLPDGSRDALRWFRWPLAIVAGILALWPAHWICEAVFSNHPGDLFNRIVGVIAIAIVICSGAIAATVQFLTPASLRLNRLIGHTVIAFLFGTLIAFAPVLLTIFAIACWLGLFNR